jgi:uncharacterized membrane protein HdeD (DUF308 family)
MAFKNNMPRPPEPKNLELSSSNYGRSWWAVFIAGLAVLAFGSWLLARPLVAVGTLIILFGALSVVFGTFMVINSLLLIKLTLNWWIVLVEGIISIIIGVMVLVWPVATLVVTVYFIAAWLIVSGITATASGATERNGLAITMGLLSFILGIFIFFRPPVYSVGTLLLFIGIFAVFRGLGLIVNSIINATAGRRVN